MKNLVVKCSRNIYTYKKEDNMKKIIAFALSTLFVCMCFAGCTSQSGNTAETTVKMSSTGLETTAQTNAAVTLSDMDIRVFTLKGPTGMGMAKLMSDAASGTASSGLNYTFTLASAPDEITSEVIKGDFEIAAVPTNLAAVLAKKTDGAVKIAAVNTLGVLYMMENGNTIKSVTDLEGKTVYATGQGSTPEYILNYILDAFDINCEVVYLAEHAELATQMISGSVTIGMLPVPNATTVEMQSDARIALDMTELWKEAAAKKGDSSALYQGCIIVNKTFAEDHPAELNAFLTEYKASVDYVNTADDAADMIAALGIIPKAEVAKQAIPDANIVFLTGDEMKTGLTGFFKVLYSLNPSSVGGAVPTNEIYY